MCGFGQGGGDGVGVVSFSGPVGVLMRAVWKSLGGCVFRGVSG